MDELIRQMLSSSAGNLSDQLQEFMQSLQLQSGQLQGLLEQAGRQARQSVQLQELQEHIGGQSNNSSEGIDEGKKILDKIKQMKKSVKKREEEKDDEPEVSSDDDEQKLSELSTEGGLFFLSAAHGNQSIMAMLLSKGVDIDYRSLGGQSALHVASYGDKSDIVIFLLSQGANINLINDFGHTPLMNVVLNKNRSMTRLLADRGADLTIKSKTGHTAADIAFMEEDLDTVDYLEQRSKTLQFDAKVHNETILHFAQKNNVKMIEFWLNNYPVSDDATKPCDLKYKDGRTIAFTAALNGSEELIALIDSLGGDLDLPDDTNSSPLFCAAQNGYENIVKKLLDWGCNVNRVGEGGRTALFSAILNGHANIARILIEAGADVNVIDDSGRSPLACSIVSGCEEIYKFLLLDTNADPTVIDKDGDGLILIAALFKRFDIVKMLHEDPEKALPLDAGNHKSGETALLAATQVRFPKLVQYLIDKGCNVNAINKNGVSPVLRAAFNSDLETVKLLAKNGAKLDIPNKRGETSILCAAQRKSLSIVQFLFKEGCNIMVTDDKSRSMALYAASTNNTELIDFLHRNHAPLDVADCVGNTPLMVAAMQPSNIAVMQKFESFGCKLNSKNHKGDTAMSIAAAQGSIDVMKFLKSKGIDFSNITVKGKTPLMQAAKKKKLNLIKYMVGESSLTHVDVNAADSKGRSAVHFAALAGHVATLDYLLEDCKADFDCMDCEGNTPLLLAVRKGHKQIVEKLVDNNADVDVRNRRGENAAHLAVLSASLDLLKYIDQHDCYLDQEDIDGKTPLIIACERKKLETIDFLISKGCSVKSFLRNGQQVIHVACETGKIKILRRLLDQKVPVHPIDMYGRTTLMLAALSGSEECVKEIIKKLKDTGRSGLVTARDSSGKTALEYGLIGSNAPQIIDLLLNEGCSVNNVADGGKTTLMAAVENNNSEEVVAKLLQHNADVNAVTDDGVTAVHEACRHGKLEIFQRLIEASADLHRITAISGDCCLTLAAASVSKQMLQRLLEAGLDPTRKNANKHSAVSLVYRRGDKEIIDCLPPHDSQLQDTFGDEGNSLLHLGCERGSESLIQNLIDQSASIETKNNKNETPLHVACRHGNCNAVEVLLKSGAEVNAVCDGGDTPLLLAISGSHKSVSELLLSNQADVNAVNSYGVSALAAALHSGKKSIVRKLRSLEARLFPNRLPSSFNLFSKNIAAGKVGLVKVMLQEGLPVNRCEMGKPLLHHAILNSSTELVNELLRQEANVQQRDDKGNTPLIAAIQAGRIDIADRLMKEYPQCLKDVNHNGENATHVAVLQKKIGTVQWMLNQGICSKDATREGATALHLAAQIGSQEIFSLLRSNGFDVRKADGNGATVGHHASVCGNPHFVRNLHEDQLLLRRYKQRNRGGMRRGNSQEQLQQTQTLLQKRSQMPSVYENLVTSGHYKVVKWLFDITGENTEEHKFVDVRNAVLRSGHEKLAKFILNRSETLGIDSASKRNGETALLSAAQGGNYHLCRELIEKWNCSLSSISKHKVGVVQKTVESGSAAILRYVIDRGAPVDEPDADGNTPLLQAVLSNKLELLQLLLTIPTINCNLLHRNQFNHSAVHVAAISGSVQILRYLLQHLEISQFTEGDNGDSPLMLAVLHSNNDAVNFFIDKCNADVNHSNSEGSTAMHFAVANSDATIAEILLKCRANIDATDCDGVTPLMLAAQCECADVAELLVKREASLHEKRNKFGDSAFSLLRYSPRPEMQKLVEEISEEAPRPQCSEQLGRITSKSQYSPKNLIEETPADQQITDNNSSEQEDEEEEEPADSSVSETEPQPPNITDPVAPEGQRRSNAQSIVSFSTHNEGTQTNGQAIDQQQQQRPRRSMRRSPSISSSLTSTSGPDYEPEVAEAATLNADANYGAIRDRWSPEVAEPEQITQSQVNNDDAVSICQEVTAGKFCTTITVQKNQQQRQQQYQWKKLLREANNELQDFDTDSINLSRVLSLQLITDDQLFLLKVTMQESGQSLMSILSSQLYRQNNGALTEQAGKDLAKGILSGLSYLHSKAVLHGNLSVHCLLLPHQATTLADIKICRFGRAMQLVASRANNAGESEGVTASESGDIYDFGSTLHFVLLGVAPRVLAPPELDPSYIVQVFAAGQRRMGDEPIDPLQATGIFPPLLQRVYARSRQSAQQQRSAQDLLHMLDE